MKALSRLVLSVVTAAGAVAALSTQAQATLQFSVGFGGSEQFFTCVDNSACDRNPATGAISVPEISFEGITAHNVTVTATPGSLSFTVGSLTNDSGDTLFANFGVSDTGFDGPGRLKSSFFTEWRDAPRSSLDVALFDDPANAQGAKTPTDAPGSQFDSFSAYTGAGNGTGGYSDNIGAPAVSPPFSLTVQGNVELANGGTESASESVSAAIPEASTWTMLIAGFAGLGIAGYRVSRKRSALAV